ncbi:MAG: hypothetical protein CMN30_28885 [Sandaracinus sp.]|nr:hypothetical protein [Sandaracinus sp.]
MSHEIELDGELSARLHAADEALVEEARARGCPRCGDRLHRADYPRKVRGVGEAAEIYFARRFALCCAEEGCRPRVLPPSVRFLGHKVYALLAIAAACMAEVAHRQWQERRRIARWLAWWREVFATSAAFTELRGRMATPVDCESLPTSLYERVRAPSRALRFACLVAGVAPPRAHGY